VFEHVEGIRRRNMRGTLPAAGVAALLHVLLIALLIWGVRSKVLLAIEPTGKGPDIGFPEGGGGGGGGNDGEMVSYVELAPAPTVQAEPVPVPEEDVLIPPEPTPVPPTPQPETPKVEAPREPVAPPAPTNAGTGGGTGGGQGQGEGPGEGTGVGPGSGSGTGGGNGSGIGTGTGPGTGGGAGRIRAPQSDVLPIPPDRPGNVASQEITIRVTVDDRGRVRDARLVSSTGNRGYDERIRRWALSLLFRPAVNLDTNRPVEAQTDIKVYV
jgi:periplasmic protein TonB